MSVDRFDAWLETHGPVAVVIHESLEPVQGSSEAFFPPTFAPPEGVKDAPDYVIDETGNGKIALVDSIGSQANRMEPIFKAWPYSELVPNATVKIGEREISVLDVGHRAADAVVRFSDKWKELQGAFRSIREKRNATPLAKLAPTSLVFGVWDSRDTQVKMPRLVGSTIRAYGVEKLTRAAQFFAATEKEEIEELGSQKFLSQMGLDDAPAGRTSGGVISRAGIRRQAVLNLVALRALMGATDVETRKLQRYTLALALLALLAPSDRFLREGCLLVPIEGKPAELKLVGRTGRREDLSLTESDALDFAKLAAAEFGVGSAWTATFSPEAVRKAAKEGDNKPKRAAK